MKVTLLKKALCLGLASTLSTQAVLGSMAESNIWKERRVNFESSHSKDKSLLLASLPTDFSTTALLSKQSSLNKAISSPLLPKSISEKLKSQKLKDLASAISLKNATIQDVYDSGFPNQSPLILIQDVHLNPEAQTNIAFVLKKLIDDSKIAVVGVEGAFTHFDFSPFKNLGNETLRQNVSLNFMNQKKMAAPSFVGITSGEGKARFVGVDDLDHYEANVSAYLSTRRTQAQTKRNLEDLQIKLEVQKSKELSDSAKKFDEGRTSYNKGILGLSSYVMKLKDVSTNKVDVGFTIDRFIEASEMESKINFDKVEQERQVVLEKLTAVLSEKELSGLLAQSLAYKSGELSFGDYYQNLKILCEQHGVSLKKTPSFDQYIQYVLLSDGINANELFNEVAQLEQNVKKHLFQSETEKTLLTKSEFLDLSAKLIDFSLSPNEWKTYKNLKTKFGENNFDLSSYEQFYREANLRSEKMLSNLLKESANQSPVLIAGGFHTPDITPQLKAKNMSYVVIAPKVTKVDDSSASNYLSIFDRDKTPLEKIFSGEKLFVNPASQEIGSQMKVPSQYIHVSEQMTLMQETSENLKSGLEGKLTSNASYASWPKTPKWGVEIFISPVTEFFQTFTPYKFISSHNNKNPDGSLNYWVMVPRIVGLALMHLTTTGLLIYLLSDSRHALSTTHIALSLLQSFLIGNIGVHAVFNAVIWWAPLSLSSSVNPFADVFNELNSVSDKTRKEATQKTITLIHQHGVTSFFRGLLANGKKTRGLRIGFVEFLNSDEFSRINLSDGDREEINALAGGNQPNQEVIRFFESKGFGGIENYFQFQIFSSLGYDLSVFKNNFEVLMKYLGSAEKIKDLLSQIQKNSLTSHDKNLNGGFPSLLNELKIEQIRYVGFPVMEGKSLLWIKIPAQLAEFFDGYEMSAPYTLVRYFAVDHEIEDRSIWDFFQVHSQAKDRLQSLVAKRKLGPLRDQDFEPLVKEISELVFQFTNTFNGSLTLFRVVSMCSQAWERLKATMKSDPDSVDRMSESWAQNHLWNESRVKEAKSLNELINFIHGFYLSHRHKAKISSDNRVSNTLPIQSEVGTFLLDSSGKISHFGSMKFSDFDRDFNRGTSAPALHFLLDHLPIHPTQKGWADIQEVHDRDYRDPSGTYFFGNHFTGDYKLQSGGHFFSIQGNLSPSNLEGRISVTQLGGGGRMDDEDGHEREGNIARTAVFAELTERISRHISSMNPQSPFSVAKFIPVSFMSMDQMVNVDLRLGRHAEDWDGLPMGLTFEQTKEALKANVIDPEKPSNRIVLDELDRYTKLRETMFQPPDLVQQEITKLNRMLRSLGLDLIPSDTQFLNSVILSRYVINPIVDDIKSKEDEYVNEKLVPSITGNPDDIAVRSFIRIFESDEIEQLFKAADILNVFEPKFFIEDKPLFYLGRFIFSRVKIELQDDVLIFYVLRKPSQRRILAGLLANKKLSIEQIQSKLATFYPLNLKPIFPKEPVSLQTGMQDDIPVSRVQIEGHSFSPGLAPAVGRLVSQIPMIRRNESRFVLLVDELTDTQIADIARDPRIICVLQTNRSLANTSSHINIALNRLGVHRVALPIGTQIEKDNFGRPIRLLFESPSTVKFRLENPIVETHQIYNVQKIIPKEYSYELDNNDFIEVNGQGILTRVGKSKAFRKIYVTFADCENARNIHPMDSLSAENKPVRLDDEEKKYFLSRILNSNRFSPDQKLVLFQEFQFNGQEIKAGFLSVMDEVNQWAAASLLQVSLFIHPKEILFFIGAMDSKIKLVSDGIFVLKNLNLDQRRFPFLADLNLIKGSVATLIQTQWRKLRILILLEMNTFSQMRYDNLHLVRIKRLLRYAFDFGLSEHASFKKLVKKLNQRMENQYSQFKSKLMISLKDCFHLAMLVGGKARELGEGLALEEALKVEGPAFIPGVVLTSNFYFELIAPLELSLRSMLLDQSAIHHALEVAWENTFPISEGDFFNQLDSVIKNNPSGRFAVRSAEQDESSASVLPGTHLSIIGVSRDHLKSAILKVVASNWSPQSVAVRQSHGIDPIGGFMSVIIQPVDDVIASGVLVIDGDDVSVSSTYGLMGVVHEESGIDVAQMNSPSGFISKVVANKSHMWVLDSEGEGAKLVKVSEEKQKVSSLNEIDLEFLYTLAKTWQDYYRHPLVIEYVKSKDNLIKITDIKFNVRPWDQVDTSVLTNLPKGKFSSPFRVYKAIVESKFGSSKLVLSTTRERINKLFSKSQFFNESHFGVELKNLFTEIIFAPISEFFQTFNPYKFISSHNNKNPDGSVNYWVLAPRIIGLTLMHLTTTSLLIYFASDSHHALSTTHLALSLFKSLIVGNIGVHAAYNTLIRWAPLTLEQSRDSALKLFQQYPLLQTYEVKDLKTTLTWLASHRAELGNNSLSYLVLSLAVADRLPKYADEETWQRSAGAYDFYLNSSLLQSYEPKEMKETLKWLANYRSELGDNSLGYLAQSLAVADRLPKDADEETWQRSAGAYDFYLNSSLLQSYEPKEMKRMLTWLAGHRSELGGNSLSYLVQSLAVADRLPKDANEGSWQFSAGAYDFYLNSSLLQSYEPKEIKETLKWLASHRSELGGNSLSYLVQSLAAADRLSNVTDEVTWHRSAGAYDFYLNSSLLQSYEPKEIKETLKWLASHRSELAGNSLSYLVQSLAVADQLPVNSNQQGWGVHAGAFDRALLNKDIILEEINRIWSQPNNSGLTGLRRLRKEFNTELLLNLKTKKPISSYYRNLILNYAYGLYGKAQIEEIEKSKQNSTLTTTITYKFWPNTPKWIVEIFISPVREFFQTFNPYKFISSHNNKNPDGSVNFWMLVPRIIGLTLMHLTTTGLLITFLSDSHHALSTTHFALSLLKSLIVGNLGVHAAYNTLIRWAPLSKSEKINSSSQRGGKYFDWEEVPLSVLSADNKEIIDSRPYVQVQKPTTVFRNIKTGEILSLWTLDEKSLTKLYSLRSKSDSVGMILLKEVPEDEIVNVLNFKIDSAAQGKGYGKLLILWAYKQAQKKYPTCNFPFGLHQIDNYATLNIALDIFGEKSLQFFELQSKRWHSLARFKPNFFNVFGQVLIQKVRGAIPSGLIKLRKVRYQYQISSRPQYVKVQIEGLKLKASDLKTGTRLRLSPTIPFDLRVKENSSLFKKFHMKRKPLLSTATTTLVSQSFFTSLGLETENQFFKISKGLLSDIAMAPFIEFFETFSPFKFISSHDNKNPDGSANFWLLVPRIIGLTLMHLTTTGLLITFLSDSHHALSTTHFALSLLQSFLMGNIGVHAAYNALIRWAPLTKASHKNGDGKNSHWQAAGILNDRSLRFEMTILQPTLRKLSVGDDTGVTIGGEALVLKTTEFKSMDIQSLFKQEARIIVHTLLPKRVFSAGKNLFEAHNAMNQRYLFSNLQKTWLRKGLIQLQNILRQDDDLLPDEIILVLNGNPLFSVQSLKTFKTDAPVFMYGQQTEHGTSVAFHLNAVFASQQDSTRFLRAIRFTLSQLSTRPLELKGYEERSLGALHRETKVRQLIHRGRELAFAKKNFIAKIMSSGRSPTNQEREISIQMMMEVIGLFNGILEIEKNSFLSLAARESLISLILDGPGYGMKEASTLLKEQDAEISALVRQYQHNPSILATLGIDEANNRLNWANYHYRQGRNRGGDMSSLNLALGELVEANHDGTTQLTQSLLVNRFSGLPMPGSFKELGHQLIRKIQLFRKKETSPIEIRKSVPFSQELWTPQLQNSQFDGGKLKGILRAYFQSGRIKEVFESRATKTRLFLVLTEDGMSKDFYSIMNEDAQEIGNLTLSYRDKDQRLDIENIILTKFRGQGLAKTLLNWSYELGKKKYPFCSMPFGIDLVQNWAILNMAIDFYSQENLEIFNPLTGVWSSLEKLPFDPFTQFGPLKLSIDSAGVKQVGSLIGENREGKFYISSSPKDVVVNVDGYKVRAYDQKFNQRLNILTSMRFAIRVKAKLSKSLSSNNLSKNSFQGLLLIPKTWFTFSLEMLDLPFDFVFSKLFHTLYNLISPIFEHWLTFGILFILWSKAEILSPPMLGISWAAFVALHLTNFYPSESGPENEIRQTLEAFSNLFVAGAIAFLNYSLGFTLTDWRSIAVHSAINLFFTLVVKLMVDQDDSILNKISNYFSERFTENQYEDQLTKGLQMGYQVMDRLKKSDPSFIDSLQREQNTQKGIAQIAEEAAGHPFEFLIYPGAGADLSSAVPYSKRLILIEQKKLFLDDKALFIEPESFKKKFELILRTIHQHGITTPATAIGLTDIVVEMARLGVEPSSIRVNISIPLKKLNSPIEIITLRFSVKDKNYKVSFVNYELPLQQDSNLNEIFRQYLTGITNGKRGVVLTKAGGDLSQLFRLTSPLYKLIPDDTVIISDQGNGILVEKESLRQSGRLGHLIDLTDHSALDALQMLFAKNKISYGYSNTLESLYFLRFVVDSAPQLSAELPLTTDVIDVFNPETPRDVLRNEILRVASESQLSLKISELKLKKRETGNIWGNISQAMVDAVISDLSVSPEQNLDAERQIDLSLGKVLTGDNQLRATTVMNLARRARELRSAHFIYAFLKGSTPQLIEQIQNLTKIYLVDYKSYNQLEIVVDNATQFDQLKRWCDTYAHRHVDVVLRDRNQTMVEIEEHVFSERGLPIKTSGITVQLLVTPGVTLGANFMEGIPVSERERYQMFLIILTNTVNSLVIEFKDRQLEHFQEFAQRVASQA